MIRRTFARGMALLAFAQAATAADDAVRVLDPLDDASAWTALASDQVAASLRVAADGGGGRALCLRFDFHGVSGYAAMRRPLAIDYPDHYRFEYRLRGDAPTNALQLKLIDASGDNVWWLNRPDVRFPRQWQAQRVRKREVAFAWGPATDRTLRHSAAIEFTISAGHGGRGEVCFDQLALRTLPAPPDPPPAPRARATSSLAGAPAANAVDGDPATAWRSDPGRGREQALTLDLGYAREFGGLVLHWHGGAFASRYDIELSDDGRDWRRVRRVVAGNGGDDPLYLPDSEARHVRVSLHAGPAASFGTASFQRKRGSRLPSEMDARVRRHDVEKGMPASSGGAYALDEIEVRDLAFGASANAFFSGLAKSAPRGRYPRGFHDEQTYWTVVGVDGGRESGLLSEDGALEVARGGFSIEPFLVERGALTSWADVDIAHSLADGYLPIPRVEWSHDGLRLAITAFGSGERGASRLLAAYTLENTSDRERSVTLALAVRPFQVNPAVQFLNTPGGVSPIHDLAFAGTTVSVDGKPRVFALAPPDAVLAAPFDAGMAVERLASDASLPAARAAAHDDGGLASGALLYRVRLAAHARRTIGLAIPLDGAAQRPAAPAADAQHWLSAQQAVVAAGWHRELDGVALRLPPQGRPLADTLRTALADILLSRDGAAIRPGTRAYARSWIRDGAMISDALLRLGHADAARDYLEWYAPYQFRSGKVPCCVDARGSDPVAENDSHGELIHLVAEVYRHTRDGALLRAMWPHVAAAVAYMDALRASERTPSNRQAPRRAFYGLMPASISHEGYSAKPMHSYWDDFWALTGYDDALDIAAALGRRADARRFRASRDEFRDDLYASIRAAVAAHRIDYLPGCAELGDFDPTSTTIALSPAGQQAALPRDLLHATFERYWTNFAARRDHADWKDYTPYEWRTVGTFVRLGWRERAEQASRFFLRDRRPAGWNQWAEVVGRDPRESRFIGDMPHGWVASDFIRATLDRFAYERAVDHAVVLAAGVPSAWLDDEGIAIEHLRTAYGSLSYSLKRSGEVLHLHIDAGGMQVPPGGFVLAWPGGGPRGIARLHGRELPWRGDELRIATLPADLAIGGAALPVR